MLSPCYTSALDSAPVPWIWWPWRPDGDVGGAPDGLWGLLRVGYRPFLLRGAPALHVTIFSA